MRGALALAALALAPCLLSPGLAGAEVTQKGDLRVAFQGKLSPRSLPREGTAPVSVSLGGQIATTDGTEPPALERLQIAINRHGHLDYSGLPSCSLRQIQPSTTAGALAACRSSLVGRGSFSAAVAIPEQSPFPSRGKLLAFNGTQGRRPVIFAHVFGTEPVPTSFTLPLRISPAKGAYGTLLSAELPQVTSNVAFVTGLTLNLGRRFSYRGQRRSYLSAGCPAPVGFSVVSFPLLRASFAFAGGRTLGKVLVRSCRVG